MFSSISRTPVRTLATVLLIGSAGLLATPPPVSAAPDRSAPAPVVGADRAGVIPGQYIVVMKGRAASARAEARRQAVKQGGHVTFDYTVALNGFAAKLPGRAVEALRHNPNIAYIEADSQVSTGATQSPATWGLDRIDQRSLPLSNSYTYNFTGSGVTAYIIDTGIRSTHTQFGGRVGPGFTSISDGRGTQDCNGHGTHVAGTVGSSTYGVAKSVNLRPVRVLSCSGSGSNSGVIAGVDWVTANAVKPAVANMSLGGSVSSSLDTAVNNSIASGVTYALAAGNDNTNACNGSPSRVAAGLTVGSTTSSDARSSFSNYGTCVDLFAPGSSITSAWSTSDTATNTISGTSMATPHVAGVAALYLQANPSASPSAVSSAIIANATPNVVTNPGSGSPNRLLHSLFGSTPPPPPPPPGGNRIVNPGFESGSTGWSATAGVINTDGAHEHAGVGYAWLNGYGSSHTDTLSQTVTIPAASSATLSFWLQVVSSETTTSVQYDRLTVQVISGGVTTTLATYSNLNKGAYAQRVLNMNAFVGKTVTVKFTGTEDYSLATSFFVDDTSLTTS